MKTIIYLTPLFLLSVIASWGQEGLMIKNTRNGKAWIYEKNARVTYILFQEQEYTTGTLNTLLDSSVIFGKDTIAIKDIAGIRKKNPIHKIARIVGMPLMLIGSLLMGQGAASVYSNPDSEGRIKSFLLGATIFIAGYIPYELYREDLTVGFGGEWTLEIHQGKP